MYAESVNDLISRQDEEFLGKFVPLKDDRADVDYCCCHLVQSKRNVNNRNTLATVWTSSSPCVVSPRDYSVPVNRTIVWLNMEHVDTRSNEDSDNKQFIARKPWGITSSTRSEQFYLTDRKHHVVMVFSPEGDFLFQFGGAGAAFGKFNRPTGIAHDAVADRVVVADTNNHRVQIFTSNGQFIFSFGAVGVAVGFFWFPCGVAVSKDGQRIVVSETGNHRVQLFSKDGCCLRKIGLRPKKLASSIIKPFPMGVAFDLTGQYLYISDLNLSCIFRYDLVSHTMVKLLNHRQLHRPSGIDVDAQGNILVCENKQHLIKVFTPGAQPLAQLKDIGGTALEMPKDICVLRAGFIALMDKYGRLMVF